MHILFSYSTFILMAYLIIFIISVINNQSADMDMDVDPPAFTRLGTEHNLNNMDVTSEDGETLAMTRELRNTGGTYSLYLLILIYHILILNIFNIISCKISLLFLFACVHV